MEEKQKIEELKEITVSRGLCEVSVAKGDEKIRWDRSWCHHVLVNQSLPLQLLPLWPCKRVLQICTHSHTCMFGKPSASYKWKWLVWFITVLECYSECHFKLSFEEKIKIYIIENLKNNWKITDFQLCIWLLKSVQARKIWESIFVLYEEIPGFLKGEVQKGCRDVAAAALPATS